MPLIAALVLIAFQSAPAQQQPPSSPPQAEQPAAKPKKGKDSTEAKGQKKPKKKKEDGKKEDKKEKKTYPYFQLDEHPSIHFAKGTHLDFRARFAADDSNTQATDLNDAELSTFDLGKKRLGVSGEIHNDVEFQVEAELTDFDPWRDVYGEYKHFAFARVRGGKFKLPFSYDENTGASHLDFMFRSLAATHLSPSRDIGVMVHGRVWNKVIGYEAGVFEHDGKAARTNNPDKVFGGQTTAARVTFEPLRNRKDAPGDLSIGAAFTTSDVPEGIAGLRGQTVLSQNFFSSSKFIVNGTRRRTGIEMAFIPGPASIKAEWMRVETQRLGESVADTDLSPLIGEGWYVSGTYVVTGQKKSSVERPKKPLLQGGIGNVEVAARVESLEFKSGASGETPSASPRADVVLGNRDQVTTLGVNWYPIRFVKVQLNFIHEKLDDPSQGPLPSKPSFTTTAVRLQFSF
jgi:phosphate-selective porin